MRKILFLVLMLAFTFSASGQETSGLVLENAKVIDVETGKIELLNVKIKNGRIAKVSRKRIKGERKFDLKGKYILPHLWDMHVHIQGDKTKLEKLVRFGVLGVRDAGTFERENLNRLIKWSSSNTKNKFLPKIYNAGFIHNGSPCEVKEHQTIDNEADLKKNISFQKENGIGFFKIHNCFPEDLFAKLGKLGKKENIKVFGHIPEGFDPIEYARLNVSSIEHMDIILRALSFRKKDPLKLPDAVKLLDGEYLDELGKVLIENNVALTPTLVTYENFINTLPENQRPLATPILKRLQQYTKRLSDQGVLLLAGTDLGLPGIEPGRSLHRELELMVEAGLTPLEAIKTATINPAKYLGIKDFSVSKKSAADFIILNKNPLEDIKNLKNIHAVVRDGSIKSFGNDLK